MFPIAAQHCCRTSSCDRALGLTILVEMRDGYEENNHDEMQVPGTGGPGTLRGTGVHTNGAPGPNHPKVPATDLGTANCKTVVAGELFQAARRPQARSAEMEWGNQPGRAEDPTL